MRSRSSAAGRRLQQSGARARGGAGPAVRRGDPAWKPGGLRPRRCLPVCGWATPLRRWIQPDRRGSRTLVRRWQCVAREVLDPAGGRDSAGCGGCAGSTASWLRRAWRPKLTERPRGRPGEPRLRTLGVDTRPSDQARSRRRRDGWPRPRGGPRECLKGRVTVLGGGRLCAPPGGSIGWPTSSSTQPVRWSRGPARRTRNCSSELVDCRRLTGSVMELICRSHYRLFRGVGGVAVGAVAGVHPSHRKAGNP